MLTKPILSSNKVIDASAANSINFIVIGGSQFISYKYEIYNNNTSSLVVQQTVSSTSAIIHLSSNTLENGIDYRVHVKTISATEESEYSEYMILKCYSTPTVSITNFIVDGNVKKINNQNFIFNGSYSQSEDVLLKYYQYILYDANNNLIKEYNRHYQTTGALTQTIGTLDNTTYYKIELICVDQNDYITTTGRIGFYVEYISPRIKQVLNLTNDSDTASIRIECDIRQLKFIPSGDVDFQDGEYIDLSATDSYIYMDNSFTLDSDFGLQIWVQAAAGEIVRIKENNNDNSNYFTVSIGNDKRVHASKQIGDIHLEYISDEFNGFNEPYMVYVMQKNRRMDVFVKKIEGTV